MPYQYATENKDYSDYASGCVFYAAPGHPAFPVRLASEVFLRCQAIRQKKGLTHPATLYDPCCGSAYHLSTLAYLHWFEIGTIMASDIDAGILSIAARNLSLLTPQGLEKRAQEITGLLDQYGKPSHALAAESVQRFSRQLNTCSQTHPITTQLFKADATIRAEVTSGIMGRQIDIVMADVPYGMLSKWQSPAHETTTINTGFLELMLGALLPVLSTDSMVAIMSNKAQKCNHPQYQRLGRFQVGKRLVTLLQPGQG